FLPALLLHGVDELAVRGGLALAAGGLPLALVQFALVGVELEPDAVGDEGRVSDVAGRPVVAVLELEQAAVAAGGVGGLVVEAEADLFAECRAALADVVATLGRERQAVEVVLEVAADVEGDRLRVGPL